MIAGFLHDILQRVVVTVFDQNTNHSLCTGLGKHIVSYIKQTINKHGRDCNRTQSVFISVVLRVSRENLMNGAKK